MTKIWHNIHPSFRLNGNAHTKQSLEELAGHLCGSTHDHEVHIGQFLLKWLDNDDAVHANTSGTTGTPKIISIKKEYCVNSARATGTYFDLLPGQTALLCLSVQHIAGKMMLVRAMVLGLQLDVVEPSSNPLKNTTKEYDFTAMVPLQVTNSLRQLDQIKKLIIGGAPVSVKLRKALMQKETTAYETYGMTETVTHVGVKKINGARSPEATSYFETLPNVTIRKDERGCLVINAPKISEKEIVTNDLVDVLDEQNFVWLGRYDNIINSGGVKLIPEQIEFKLSKIITERFFVAGIPDETLGEKLILVVEGHIESENLLERIKELDALDKFERLKTIYTLNQFISTSNGKVDRQRTLAMILDQPNP